MRQVVDSPSPALPPRTSYFTEAATVASYQLFSHTVKGFVETCNSRRLKSALKEPDELVATLRTPPCHEALTWRCCEHSTQCHKMKVKQCRRAWKQLKESSLNQLGNSLINLSIIKVAAINCNWKLFYFHSWLKFKLWYFIWCQFDASVLESSIVYSFFFLETRKIYFYNLSLSALKVLLFFWLHLFSWFICQVRQT